MFSRREILVSLSTVPLMGCKAAPREGAAAAADPPLRMLSRRATHVAVAASGGVLMVGGFAREGSGVAMVERFDPARRRFERFAMLDTPRIQPSALALGDGSVLVAGGWGDAEDRSTAELILADGTVTPLGAMRDRRTAAAAILLVDGRALITGGSRPGYRMLASAELYDPRTREFTAIAPMRIARSGHSATLLADGRVLIAGGGEGGDIRVEAELFDPATGAFSPLSDMGHARYKHGAVVMADGSPLMIGGSDDRSGPDGRGRLDVCERFDTALGRFVPAPSLNRARYKLNTASVAMPGGEIVVASGADVAEIWRPASRRFETLARFDTRRDFMSATPIGANGLLVAGGYDAAIEASDAAWLLSV